MQRSIESGVSRIVCFFFVFFCLFGWKYSFIDLSILIPGILILISSRSAKFERHVFWTAIGVLILIFYQVIVQMFLLENDLDSILRLFRCFIFCLLASWLAGSRCFTGAELANALFQALLFHALLIVLAGFFQPLNELFSDISGNERIKPFRASGLLAGFDIAGFFCLAGAAMLVFELIATKSKFRYYVYFSVFALASYFTSRLTVAWLLLLAIPFLISTYKSTKGAILRFIYSGLFIVAAIYAVIYYFLPIIDVTYSLNLVEVSDHEASEIVSRHAQQQEGSLFWEDMFYLPDTWQGLVFGMGRDVLDSDVGYIKDIFRYGLIGVFYSICFYLMIFRMTIVRARIYFHRGYVKYMWFIFSFMIVMSLKNNYFFTRGVFSLLILSLCIFFMIDRRSSENQGTA